MPIWQKGRNRIVRVMLESTGALPEGGRSPKGIP